MTRKDFAVDMPEDERELVTMIIQVRMDPYYRNKESESIFPLEVVPLDLIRQHDTEIEEIERYLHRNERPPNRAPLPGATMYTPSKCKIAIPEMLLLFERYFKFSSSLPKKPNRNGVVKVAPRLDWTSSECGCGVDIETTSVLEFLGCALPLLSARQLLKQQNIRMSPVVFDSLDPVERLHKVAALKSSSYMVVGGTGHTVSLKFGVLSDGREGQMELSYDSLWYTCRYIIAVWEIYGCSNPDCDNHTRLQTCARCQDDQLPERARYCGKECQTAHWPQHKHIHKKIRP